MCLQAGAGKAMLPRSASSHGTPDLAALPPQNHSSVTNARSGAFRIHTFIYKSQALNPPVVEEFCFFCRCQNFRFKVCSLYLQCRKKGNQHHHRLLSHVKSLLLHCTLHKFKYCIQYLGLEALCLFGDLRDFLLLFWGFFFPLQNFLCLQTYGNKYLLFQNSDIISVHYRITESFRCEKTFKITKSSCKYIWVTHRRTFAMG